MSRESEGTIDPSQVDASLEIQDEPIINVFAHSEHDVLTTAEIASEVDLSDRQVRRRLKDLSNRGIVATRRPGQSALWWLPENVKEPITAQYPLLQYTYRPSVQLFLIGLAMGIATVILVMTSMLIYAYDVVPPFVGQSSFLQSALVASMLAGGFIFAGIIVAILNRLLRYFGIELPL